MTPAPINAPSQASFFLEALFADKPDKLYILIWTLRGGDKCSRWFQDALEASAYVDTLQGWNAYVGVGLSPSDFGESKRCVSESVAGLVGFAADVDLKSEAHPKGSRPTTTAEALSVLPTEFPPSFVVETGNGIQAWWLFKEPLIFENEAERQQTASTSERWQTLLKYKAQKRGWTFERLGDLARVLRVPGTQNVKDLANPKAVKIRASSQQRYNLSDFRDYLDDMSIPSDEALAEEAKKLGQVSTETLSINITAAIPEELLTQWMKEDARFSRTWGHEREDLDDQSQSGYDLALSSFGVKRGFTDQQIINLLIHNRRLSGAKQSKVLDYYRRTISKARTGTIESFSSAGQVTASGSVRTVPRVQEDRLHGSTYSPDPNADAKLCDQISATLGVTILRISKLNGSDPIYLVELESGTIEFATVAKLLSQKCVKEALAARAGKLIRKFSAKQWDQLAQMMLDACVEIEGTDDLEFKGAARIHITKYLSENPPTPAMERLKGPNEYGPLVDDDQIAISATDLQIFILHTTNQNLSVIRAAAMISAVGGESVRIRRGNFKEQSRWVLPVAEWDSKDCRTGSEAFDNGQ